MYLEVGRPGNRTAGLRLAQPSASQCRIDCPTAAGNPFPRALVEDVVVQVALVQTHADDAGRDNLARTLELIDRAATAGAEIVCLQELFMGPYFCQEEDHSEFDRAEAVPGPTTKLLSEKAKEHGIVLLASLFERRAKGLYHNTLAIIDADGSYLGKYRKMHIPDDPRFYEKFYFAPGDAVDIEPAFGAEGKVHSRDGFVAWDTAFGRIGTLVCWDQWYPEAARATALLGADILFYPTAIGTWHGEMDHKDEQCHAWQAVQRGHAVANGVYTVAVNRVGIEGELKFWGHSFVVGPAGQTIVELGEEEEIVVVDLDLEAIETQRRGWPFFRDRRVDAYGGLLRRFGQ
jgi:N-carbamoylputrescine amidase